MKLKITFERNCNLKSFYGSKINFKNESPELENKDKSLNIYETWSRKQIPKSLAMQGPRFENVDIGKQPNPTPAIHLISKISVKKVHENIVSCDGGGGKLGHPKIYINLVKIILN